MLWDLYQQRQIEQLKQSVATAAGNSAAKTQLEFAKVQDVLESLVLSCQAMWELLRERGNLTDDMLLRKMQEVDLRDGKRDGKIGAQASTCSACSRPNNMRHQSCIYCGAALPPPQHVFA